MRVNVRTSLGLAVHHRLHSLTAYRTLRFSARELRAENTFSSLTSRPAMFRHRIQVSSVLLTVALVFFLSRVSNFVSAVDTSRRNESKPACNPGSTIGRRPACVDRVVRYHPSDTEASWLKAISNVKSDERSWNEGCHKVRAEESELREMISGIQRLAGAEKEEISKRHLSSHEVENCAGVKRRVYLEPLVSFLRHPLALCAENDDVDVLDKSYLLVPRVEEVTHADSYKWLFDAGASTYNTGAGGASQSWFVETYRARGIEFDRIIGWEAARTDPKTQWGDIPADIKRKTSWYNIPASATVGHADNPLTFIKALTKPEDFVVFKLDIDTPEVEVSLVQQLMNDTELHTLIDEFYFEHHVKGSPMQWHGWGDLRRHETPLNDIQDSYEVFYYLREKGIRAHSWV